MCRLFRSLHVFSPAVAKNLLKVLALMVGFCKLHLVFFNFPGTSSLSRFQVSLGFFLALLSATSSAYMIMLHFWFFNQLTNHHFLLFVLCFLLQFGSIFHDWLVFIYIRIYFLLISFFMLSVIHLAGGLFINFTLNEEKSLELVKNYQSVFILEYRHYLFHRFSWLERCISLRGSACLKYQFFIIVFILNLWPSCCL